MTQRRHWILSTATQPANHDSVIFQGNKVSRWLRATAFGLVNRLEKDKAKAGSKSSVPNQSRRGSKKVKSVWAKVQPKRDRNGPHTKPKLNRSHNISARALMDAHTG
ncbi:hypothetical protein F511_10859 [Dorcoceras hygrometricum]|uniref:Uncharacterized protein n=1 Tax=Dorcoceras hygrometricum TaxID=472368 RepID=A0A2Z7A9P4_9LAMI|nr:hypothetical protein F511_10859 [Dorcoceras hygrometricum]